MIRSLLRKKQTFSKPLEISLVGVVLAVFVALAMATIGAASIWFDEAFGVYLIRFSFADVLYFTGMDVHPPLYYWLLKAWSMVFGTSDVALRSMSVLFGVVALAVGYLLVRRIFGQRLALIVLPFMALSPLLMRYAQEARMYTLVLAIGLAATYVLLLASQRSSRKLWALYAVLIAAGMWTHYFMAFVWLGHWVWRALQTRKKQLGQWAKALFTKQWVGTHVLAVALFAPWLPYLAKQAFTVQAYGFWIPPIGLKTLPSYLAEGLSLIHI